MDFRTYALFYFLGAFLLLGTLAGIGVWDLYYSQPNTPPMALQNR